MAHKSRHSRPSGRGHGNFRNDFGGRSYHDWDDESYSVKLPKTNNLNKKGENNNKKN